MAYSKKKKEENKTNWIEVESDFVLENDIQITKITFYPISKGNLLAKAQVVLNDLLVLDNILICETKDGKKLYCSMPSNSYKSGDETKYKDIYFFIKTGIPKKFGDFILEKYEESIK